MRGENWVVQVSATLVALEEFQHLKNVKRAVTLELIVVPYKYAREHFIHETTACCIPMNAMKNVLKAFALPSRTASTSNVFARIFQRRQSPVS